MTSLQPADGPGQPREHDAAHVVDDDDDDSSAGDARSNLRNSQTVDQNGAITLGGSPASSIAFQSTTTAPSPPPTFSISPSKTQTLSVISTAVDPDLSKQALHPTPISAGLRLQTDLVPLCSVTSAMDNNSASTRKSGEFGRLSKPIGVPQSREPSVKQAFAHSVGSTSNFGSAPNSAMSSPMLSAMTDVTPLPSPLMSNDSPGPWKKLAAKRSSKEYNMPGALDSALITTSGESVASAILNQTKRKAYNGLVTNASDASIQDMIKNIDGHARNRSISEYVPDAVQAPKTRQQSVSGSHTIPNDQVADSSCETQLRREPQLAAKRGIAPPLRPLTPPSSRTGGESSDSDSSLSNANAFQHLQKKSRYQYFEAKTPGDQKRRRWRALKPLGEGTFSKVVLATSQVPSDEMIDENHVFGQMDGVVQPTEVNIDRRKLVAIKICEHGPKGGASEERVEMSLKRELEIMKSIHHPSLVHLKAWNIEETRAILVLSYCPGGDLFDVASQYKELLVPKLLQRIIAELVAAIQYLHERHIVHRDIKLENVLVNLPQQELAKDVDWITYPYSVITLTDLGLSRRVADDEKLTTRCGSDDYAAPEVIMGQPYDGRAVDAWSLGVLLYALVEARLPFDPSPGMSEGHKQRSKTSHRIARVEWCWVTYAGDDGDHEGDEAKFEAAGLKGAMEVTEGLLKRARSRWTISKVMDHAWVKEGIQVDGGIRFREEDTPDEVVSSSDL